MWKSCSCFWIFNHLDIFRFPVTLTLNKREKTSTFTGKWITIGIIIFLLYSFNQSDVLNKENPLTFTQNSVQKNRPLLWLLKEHFTLVFGVADVNNIFLNDPTIFSIDFSIYSVNNTNHDANITQMTLKPCTKKDFIEKPEEFEKLGLQGAFCLPNTEFKIGGYWDEPHIDYLDFQLVACQNSSDSPIICKPKEMIDAILPNYYVDVYITNHNVAVSNYVFPFSRNLQLYYKQIDIKMMKSMNIYLQKSIIDTDDGFFFESRNIQEKINVEIVDFDVFTRDESSALIFDTTIYVGDFENKIIRKYQKIQTLLAQLGGICNFLFFLGFIISKIENSYRLASFFGNELFIFPKIVNKEFNKLKTVNSRIETLDTLIQASSKNREKLRITSLPKIKVNKEKSNLKILTARPNFYESSPNNNKIKDDPSNGIKVLSPIDSYIQPKIITELEPNLSFHESEEKGNFSKQVVLSDLAKSARFTPYTPYTGSPKRSNTVTEKIKNVWRSSFSFKPKKNENFENLEYYQKMRNRENFFTIGFWGYIKLLFKRQRYFLTKREKLFLRSQEQISEQMDILKILKKVQEIDKLKRILLNDEQLYLFNLVSKPMVLLDSSKTSLAKEDFQDKRFKFSLSEKPNLEKDRLAKNYEKVNAAAEKSEVDQRLLKFIDEDVISFLKNEICPN